ncbi:MAG: hypothetical protein ACKOTZ_01300 [Chloroflexota bacterium]
MSRRRLAGLVACLVALIGAPAAAYGPAPVYQVAVAGPSRSVPCGTSVDLTATIVIAETGDPVRRQLVRWSLADGVPGDRLAAERTQTGSGGTTANTLVLASAGGTRRVRAVAAGSAGTVLVRVRCAAPPATPVPTPVPTRRPRATRAPERTVLTIGVRTPELAGAAPFLAATALGHARDAGLAEIRLVPAPDGLAALGAGTVDAAVVPLGDALAAIARGVPVRILAGFRSRTPVLVAAAPGIAAAEAIGDRPVVLGADAAASAVVAAALAEVGWGAAAAAARAEPAGGPETWAAALIAGGLALAPVRDRDRLALARAGARVVVDRQDFGGDVLVVPASLLAAAPRTIAALLDAYLAGLGALPDPRNDGALTDAARAAGIDVGDDVIAGWPTEIETFRAFDGGLGEPDDAGGLGELGAWAATNLPAAVPLVDALALAPLHAAQDRAGLARNPDLASRVPLPDGPITLAVPADDPGAALAAVLARGAGPDPVAIALTLVADPAAAVRDGDADLGVVPVTALVPGSGVVAIAGWADADAAAPAAVLVARDPVPEGTTIALAALLRGVAALGREDAAARAVAAAGDPPRPPLDALRVARAGRRDGALPAGLPDGSADPSVLAGAAALLGLAPGIVP